MEPPQAPIAKDALRVRLVLGKFRVAKLVKGNSGFLMTVEIMNGVKMRCDVPTVADVREGDLLTFYTEVLADLTKELPDPSVLTGKT